VHHEERRKARAFAPRRARRPRRKAKLFMFPAGSGNRNLALAFLDASLCELRGEKRLLHCKGAKGREHTLRKNCDGPLPCPGLFLLSN